MKTKDWIIEKLKENDFNREKVYTMYYEYCMDFSTPCKEESYKRQVRRYSSENRLSVIEQTKDSVKEEFNNDVYSAFVSSNWVKTPEDLIKHLNIDTNIWELTKFTRNYWGSEKNPNFQVKGGVLEEYSPEFFIKRARPRYIEVFQ
jgi:hypothetical protein